MNVPSKYGELGDVAVGGIECIGGGTRLIDPSRGFREWIAEIVVFVKLAPGPPLLVSRYSLYPVPGTAARKKLTGLWIMGCPALVTGAVSESTRKVLSVHASARVDNGFGQSEYCEDRAVRFEAVLARQAAPDARGVERGCPGPASENPETCPWGRHLRRTSSR